MQERKEIPSKPRFDYATKKAYDLLFELGYDKFPITAEQVLKDLSDFIECLPWTKARTIFQVDDPFHLRQTKADARSIKRRDFDTYLIVYDDQLGSPERQNWTILHEIGHILLGHLDDFGVTSLDRGGLTKKAYGVLEVETNWFVAEFLMPTPIVKMMGNLTADEISLIFGVSDEAANKKYKRAYGNGYTSPKYDESLLRHFYRFMVKDVTDTVYRRSHTIWGNYISARAGFDCRRCETCKSYITDVKAKYCYHCGSETRVEPTVYPFSGLLPLPKEESGYTHPLIPHKATWENRDEDKSRVDFCPNCLNQELDDNSEFCPICGSSIHNECTVEHIDLPLDTSFCPSCGAPATIGGVYEKMEKRLHAIESWTSPQFDDYIQYDHWLYVRMKIANSPAFFGSSVIPALFYTTAYFDDDDNLVIVTDTQSAANEIKKNERSLLSIIERYDKIEPVKITVKLIETT